MKKLFTSVIAAILAVSAASPACTSAIARPEVSSSEINELLEGFPYKLDDPSDFEWCVEGARNASAFINENADTVLVIGQREPDIVIHYSTDADAELFNTAVQKAAEKYVEAPRISYFNACCVIYGTSEEETKAIWDEIKGSKDIVSFDYTPQYWTYNYIGWFGNVLTYDNGTFEIFNKEYADLESFTEENGLMIEQVEVSVGNKIHQAFEVVPADGTKLNPVEMAELSVRIQREVGIASYGSSPTQPGETPESVRFVGAVSGDANTDSRLTLNDAVAVLQFVALPEKYPLTAQGRFNADCDGNAGISPGDALWIQRQDAGLV